MEATLLYRVRGGNQYELAMNDGCDLARMLEFYYDVGQGDEAKRRFAVCMKYLRQDDIDSFRREAQQAADYGWELLGYGGDSDPNEE